MQARRPTIMASVPRLYEKIYARVLDSVPRRAPRRAAGSSSGPGASGETWADLTLAGAARAGVAAARSARVADRLVFAKLRARTGGRIRLFISGGAPLSPEIAQFFYAAGLPILEGYGLTETSPVIAVNTSGHTSGSARSAGRSRASRSGSRPTARSSPAARTSCAATSTSPRPPREAIDAEGWFHTGDIGMIDADGFLRITDRKKDLIVTAGGKNIAPQPIENLAKTSKFVSQRRDARRPAAVPDHADRARTSRRCRRGPRGKDAAIRRSSGW